MVSKTKIKTKHRAKGKRWKKGQSSTSNPEKSKYREAAKNRFFNKIEGKVCIPLQNQLTCKVRRFCF